MSEHYICNSKIVERIQNGKSPPLRRRRTREYAQLQRSGDEDIFSKQHSVNGESIVFDELGRHPYLYYPDERERLLEITRHIRGEHQQTGMDNHHQGNTGLENSHETQEKHQIVKAENKILRERLQNALQREMKALKTFKKLAKENRELKNSLRKYERKALGFYDDDSDTDSSDPPIQEQEIDSTRNDTHSRIDSHSPTGRFASRRVLPSVPIYEAQESHDQRSHHHDRRTVHMEDKSTSTDDLPTQHVPESGHLRTRDCEKPSRVLSNRMDNAAISRRTRPQSAQEADIFQKRRKHGLTEEQIKNRLSWNESVVITPGISHSLQRASSTPCLIEEGKTSKQPINESGFKNQFFKRIEDIPNNERQPSFGSETDSAVFSSKELESPSQSPPLYDSPRVSRSYSPVVVDLVINQDGEEGRIPSDRSSDSGRPRSPYSASPRASVKQTNSLPNRLTQSHDDVFPDYNSTADQHGSEDNEEPQEEVIVDDSPIEEPPIPRRGRSSTVSDSISLRVEGNISGESPQTLAADIAAFLQYRQKCKQESNPGKKADSDDEESDIIEAAMVARYRARSGARRGSTMATLPDTATLQMDLLTCVGEEDLVESSNLLMAKRKALSESENNLASMDFEKRSRWSLLRSRKKMLLKQEREKSEDFKEYLTKLKMTSSHKDRDLTMYKDMHWTQLGKKPGRPASDLVNQIPESERKRRDAVWELFHSEIVYLMDHLLVLKEVFYDALLYLENEGHLMVVEPKKLFANVEDLCEVSEKFAEDLLALLKQDSSRQFGSTEAIVAAFNEFGSKVHPQYQRYCLNYSRALVYLETLKKNKQFNEYVKCCESDPRCNRLQLTDLLVAPLQHLTKYPLLLKNIRKRTSHHDQQHNSLTTTIKSVEKSIKELEGKVKWLSNYERLQDLQNNMSWPPVLDMDPKAYVPETLRGVVARQPCESLLASPKRQLLYEGPLVLYENTKIDICAFLFDDMLLLAKIRKPSQKATKKLSLVGVTTAGTESPPPTPTITRKSSAPAGSISGHQSSAYLVHKQPVPVDRFLIYDLDSYGASGLKNAFVIVHFSRFKQTLAVYTLQAPSQSLKEAWLTKLREAQSSWSDTLAQEEAAEKEHRHSGSSGSTGNAPTCEPLSEQSVETSSCPSPPPTSHPPSPAPPDNHSPPSYPHQRVIESHC